MTAPDCPFPASCPVPDPARINKTRLRSTVIAAGAQLATAARRAYWPSLFNGSGLGDTRFSPLLVGGAPVPTAYLAGSDTVALLETAFHEIPAAGGGTVSMTVDLAPRLLARVVVPRAVRVIDLRDDQLAHLGVDRAGIVSTTSAHYPCTREWAASLHGRVVGGQRTEGIMWHSRVAEVGSAISPVLADVRAEVCILFGRALPNDARTGWSADERYTNLTSGAGLLHVEEIVSLLKAEISRDREP